MTNTSACGAARRSMSRRRRRARCAWRSLAPRRAIATRCGFCTFATPDNVYGYVRSIVRDDHEAEDLTQHVFMKLMTVIVKYDDRGRAVLGLAAAPRAQRRTRPPAPARRPTPTEEVSAPTATRRRRASDRARSLHAALATLPDEQRNVMVMRHVVGLSPPEIAERMGRSRELDPRPAPPRSPGAAAGAAAAWLGALDRRRGPAGARMLSARQQPASLRRTLGAVHAAGLRRPGAARGADGRGARRGRARRLHARRARRGLRARVRRLLRDRPRGRRLLGHRGARAGAARAGDRPRATR